MALAAKDKLNIQKDFCSAISAARVTFDVAKDDFFGVISFIDASVSDTLAAVKKDVPVLKKSSFTDNQILKLIVAVASKQGGF